MKKTYHHIVFLQEQAAEETLQIINEKGCDSAIDHLLGMYGFDYAEGTDTPSAGSGDHTYTSDCGEYLLTYNTHIGYVGLEFIYLSGQVYERDPEEKYWNDCATWAERHTYGDEDLW